jgi:hypothetical protein
VSTETIAITMPGWIVTSTTIDFCPACLISIVKRISADALRRSDVRSSRIQVAFPGLLL